jgi:hypothetical protein
MRALVLLLIAVALLVWPSVSTHPSQKVEQIHWVVTSTPNYKGHPIDKPDSVECSQAGVEDSPTKFVHYPAWRDLAVGDPCPEPG